MPAPFDFPNATANFGLPLLFTGQAQKEFFVNQGFSLVDALLHHTVISSTNTPPVDAQNGSAYRIKGPATGMWSDNEDAVAIMIAGGWQFVSPVDGMQIFDQEAGQMLIFLGQWQAAAKPVEPIGGAVIDTEARSTLIALINELTKLGLFV